MKQKSTFLLSILFIILFAMAANQARAIGQLCSNNEECLSTENCQSSFCVPESRIQDYLCLKGGAIYKWDDNKYADQGICPISACKDYKSVVYGNTKEEVCLQSVTPSAKGIIITTAEIVGEKVAKSGIGVPTRLEVKNTGTETASTYFEVAIYKESFFKEFFKTANVFMFSFQQNIGAIQSPACVPSEDFVQSFQVLDLKPGESKTFLAYPKAPSPSSIVAGSEPNWDPVNPNYIVFFGTYNKCGEGHTSTRATTIILDGTAKTINKALSADSCVEAACKEQCTSECQESESQPQVKIIVPTINPLKVSRFPPTNSEVLASICKSSSECIPAGSKLKTDCVPIEKVAPVLKIDAEGLKNEYCARTGSFLFCGSPLLGGKSISPSFDVCFAQEETIFTPIEDALSDLAGQIGLGTNILFIIIIIAVIGLLLFAVLR